MPNKMNKLMLILIILLGVTALCAQINTKYAFTESSITWSPITGTYLFDAMQDEGLSFPVLINFPFPYGVNSFDNLLVSSNGWINLGSNLTLPYYANDLATLNLRPILAPLWDDLNMANGAVIYNHFGTAPHRYLTIQWLSAKWNYNATNDYNFQARLHETGQIDFIYGPHTGLPVNASASIGINIAPGGPGNYYSVYPGFPAHVSSSSQMSTIANPIAAGTMYCFMPKHTVAEDVAIANLTAETAIFQNTPADFTISVGNTGVNTLSETFYVVRLKRGDTILATRNVAATQPGIFISETIPWIPDTTGSQQLYAEIYYPADMDTTNNVSLPITVNVQPPQSNEDEAVASASLTSSHYPNPFTGGEGVFSIQNAKSALQQITIYDTKGRKVRTLQSNRKQAGLINLTWNGKSDTGEVLSSGVYFYKVTSGDDSTTHKLLIFHH